MSELTTAEMMQVQGGGTATGKLYVATDTGVFVEIPASSDLSHGKLLFGTDGGIW